MAFDYEQKIKDCKLLIKESKKRIKECKEFIRICKLDHADWYANIGQQLLDSDEKQIKKYLARINKYENELKQNRDFIEANRRFTVIQGGL